MVLHRRYPKITFVSTNETNHLDKIHNTLKATIMKKIAPIAAIALLAVTFTSCKKNYTCTCKASGKTDISIPINKVKKSDATKTCDAAQTTYSAIGYSCSL